MTFLPPIAIRSTSELPDRRATVRRPAAIVTGALAYMALVGALVACADPVKKAPAYVAPMGVPNARLAVRGSIPEGDRYGVFIFDEQERCQGPRLVGIGSRTANPTTTTLAAGQPATIEFLLQKPDKQTCRVRWTFVPATGKLYVLAARGTATGCAANVLDATDPDVLRPEPGALRRDAPSNACIALAQSRRANLSAAGTDRHGDAVLRPDATAADLQGLIGP